MASITGMTTALDQPCPLSRPLVGTRSSLYSKRERELKSAGTLTSGRGSVPMERKVKDLRRMTWRKARVKALTLLELPVLPPEIAAPRAGKSRAVWNTVYHFSGPRCAGPVGGLFGVPLWRRHAVGRPMGRDVAPRLKRCKQALWAWPIFLRFTTSTGFYSRD